MTAVLLTLPEYGHLNAALPLAAELARRGERITFYGTAPFRAAIEATGAAYADYGAPEAFTPPAHAGGLYSVMAYLAGLAETLLPGLLAELRQLRPDYLLLDSMCVWGNLAQQVLDIPAITLGAVFVTNETLLTVEALVAQAYAGAPTPVLLAAMDALNTYLMQSQRLDHAFGVQCPNLVQFFGNRQPQNVLLTSREFHPAGGHYDPSYEFVGPLLPAARPRLDFELPPGDAPLIYISLGTIFNDAPEFFRACFHAFGDQPYRVVVACGDRVDRTALGAAPENFVVRAFVPQLAVLERAAACITHAGMNTTSEALWNGVPLLCLPQHGDQHIVAARVAELGAGLTLPPGERHPEALRRDMARLLAEGSFRRQAERLATGFRTAGGAARAADVILGHAQRATRKAAV